MVKINVTLHTSIRDFGVDLNNEISSNRPTTFLHPLAWFQFPVLTFRVRFSVVFMDIAHVVQQRQPLGPDHLTIPMTGQSTPIEVVVYAGPPVSKDAELLGSCSCKHFLLQTCNIVLMLTLRRRHMSHQILVNMVIGSDKRLHKAVTRNKQFWYIICGINVIATW